MNSSPGHLPLGFHPHAIEPPRAARAAPLPKRPKGRWFVGLILMGVLAAGAHHVWSSYFRYRAYGTVTCKTIEVSSPWDGVVAFVHHRQGDRVRQGDMLMTVQSLTLRHRSAQIADEISVEQAKLEADAARIKWEAAYRLDQNRDAMAAFYELKGTIVQEQSKLEETSDALARVERPEVKGVVPNETIERLRISKRGQEYRLTTLRESLAELKQRVEEADHLLRNGEDRSVALLEQSREQLKPGVARIAALQAERARLEERLAQGEVRAPVAGIVVKHLCQVGESCKADEPIVSLLDEASLQVVLYLDQEDSNAFAPGSSVEVQLDPYDQPLHCTLVRLGDEFEPAPEAIKRHYREGQELLPVYLEPASDDERGLALRAHGVVKLSRATSEGVKVAKK